MKKFLLKIDILLVFYIIGFSSLIPLIAYSGRFNEKLTSSQNFDSTLDISNLSSSEFLKLVSTKSNLQKTDLNSVYDDTLKLFLDSYISSDSSVSEKVKIIILFDEFTTKEHRLKIISSLFEDYQIINNYNVISGIALACNPLELIEKAEEISVFTNIQKIFKSNNFQSPLIIDETPKSSKLDSEFYPNWWINAVGASNLEYDGAGIKVAVIDSGIYRHPDLNVIENQNFVWDEDLGRIPWDYEDYNGHGTHVAGIIGGDGGESGGKYKGIASGVSLINAKAGDATGGLEETDIIAAIEWLIETAKPDIISMSFGGGIPEVYDSLTLALSNATRHGILCVSSAGNSGPGYFTGGTPATGVDVISVGATDKNNNLASFSSWGPTTSYLGYPDVVAPGVNIVSTEAPGSTISDRQRYLGDFIDFSGYADYYPLSGTSMACPVVAGALAIIKQAFPLISPEAARIALMEGASKDLKFNNEEVLKTGAGLINVSSSLEFLYNITTTFGNVNNSAKIFPDSLPFKPFDLLNFPGDYQSFNLTIISGQADTYDINIPNNIDGLSLSLDKSSMIFVNPGINFTTLDVKVKDAAKPGIRNFELNITSGVTLFDTLQISIEVKLPEHQILLESYHGLNDWFDPELSFYQMDFYEAMKDLSNMNISIDYGAEYWTPYYDKDSDNSILTEERLAQYDLVVLQNPILPYSPLEINNIRNYYANGGNILFFGTRYQDLCLENINDLFYALGVNTSINEENIYLDQWMGIGTSLTPQSITDFNSLQIFNDVNQYRWLYGNTFSTIGSAQSIASITGKTVATTYDGNPEGKGRFVAFGDMHWLTEYYSSSNYYADHFSLLKNLMKYYFSENNVSINIGLSTDRISNPQLNLTIYVKNQNTELPIDSITLKSYLNVSITNGTYFEIIYMNSSEDGIATNNSYLFPYPSSTPYEINVNFTYESNIYNKTSKILYFDNSQVPIINSFSITGDITREGTDSLDISATLDATSYNTDAFLSIYTYSFYNSKQTINKTLPLSRIGFVYYTSYNPNINDPSGYALTYIIPKNPSSNYINPTSPRLITNIINNAPEFNEENSSIIIGNQIFYFNDTHDSEDNPYIIPATQGNKLDFVVQVSDSVDYEDLNASKMRVLLSLFICSVNDGYLNLIFPETVPTTELTYQQLYDTHDGIFTIPKKISYSTLTGEKLISSRTNFDSNSYTGYLALLIITVIDSDGGSDDFIIVLQINQYIDLLLILILIGVFSLLGIIILSVAIRRRKRKKAKSDFYTPEYYMRPAEEVWEPSSSYEFQEIPPEEKEYQQTRTDYCPYCGYPIGTPKKFCPNCGKSLSF